MVKTVPREGVSITSSLHAPVTLPQAILAGGWIAITVMACSVQRNGTGDDLENGSSGAGQAGDAHAGGPIASRGGSMSNGGGVSGGLVTNARGSRAPARPGGAGFLALPLSPPHGVPVCL